MPDLRLAVVMDDLSFAGFAPDCQALDPLNGLVRAEFLTSDWATVPDRPASGMAELRLAHGLGELAFWINEYGAA